MTQDVFHIVGTTIGGTYEVEKAVAEGGFGVLYRAYHGAFRAPIALKCLKIPPAVGEKDHAELLERFRKEAEVMFRLSAAIPTVVRPLHVDAFTTEEGVLVPYMVLEWLQGETLDSLIIRRAHEGKPPVPMKKLVQILTPVARALERAHRFPSEEGIVSISHCDLKPENIFLCDFHGETTAKILDFGIAKVRQATSQIIGRQSQTGELSAFSPCYAAPEQWLPKRFGAAGPWTDIWGLALTMVEAAAGRQIMSNDFQAAIGAAIDEKRRPSPAAEGVDVSDAVERVFLRALAVDPKNRYPNLASFWDALEEAVGSERSASTAKRAASMGLEPSVPPPAFAEGGIASLDAPDAQGLGLPAALAPPTPAGRGGAAGGGIPVRASQVAAALQIEPDSSRARDPASGPQPRMDAVPEVIPDLLVAPHPHREATGLRPREGTVQKGALIEAPPDVPGLSLELEGASPMSRRARAPVSERDVARPRTDGAGMKAGTNAALERTGPRLRPPMGPEVAPMGHEPDHSPEKANGLKAFYAPIGFIVVGVLIAAVDRGENQVGGVQLNWIAGGLAGIGILWGLFKLFSSAD